MVTGASSLTMCSTVTITGSLQLTLFGDGKGPEGL